MIAPDKKYHALAGVIAFAFFLFVVEPFALNYGYELTPAWGIVFAGFVGWVKERLYDWYHPKEHTVDKADAWATCAGGAVGWLAYTVVCLLL